MKTTDITERSAHGILNRLADAGSSPGTETAAATATRSRRTSRCLSAWGSISSLYRAAACNPSSAGSYGIDLSFLTTQVLAAMVTSVAEVAVRRATQTHARHSRLEMQLMRLCSTLPMHEGSGAFGPRAGM